MASSARIEELRKKFEENPRRYFAPLANEYRKAGEVEQAISICREYLPQQPGHMSGHIVYGQALYEARQFEEAKAVFETALTLDPENLIALRHLGDISLIVGDAEGAKSWYRRVLEADPRNEEIQAQLASLEQSAVSAQATPSTSTPPMGAATASSAATVVVSAIKPPSGAADSAPTMPATSSEPAPVSGPQALPMPTSPATTSSKTLELELPRGESASTQGPPPAPLELESPVAGGSPLAGQPSMGASSLAGLETTSLAPEHPAPQSLSNTRTVELTFDSIIPPTAPTLPVDAATAPEAPPVASASVGVSPAPERPTAATPATGLLELVGAETQAPPPLPTPPQATPSVPEAPLPLLDIGELGAADPAVPAPDSGPFVTETMAELYLQQGHHEEALRVYKALLEQRPGDWGLEAKVANMQPRTAPSVSAPHSPWSAETVPSRTAGPTIREVLGILALRRPGSEIQGPLNGASRTEMASPGAVLPSAAASTTATPSVAAASPAPETRAASVTPAALPTVQSIHSDSVSALFGNAPITPADEGAARSLALAFADTNGASRSRPGVSSSAGDVPGAPARRASNELSLDTVFGGGESAAPAAPSSFSFDEFFSPRASVQQSSTATPSGGPSTGSPDEVAHFTKWLEGLKQR